MLKQGRPDGISTLNIGTISGGSATNIVPDSCVIKGELRSLDHQNALTLFESVKSAFGTSAAKYGAKADIKHSIDLTAYKTPENSKAFSLYKTACEKCGVTPQFIETFGGSDNNNFALHGIEGLVVSVGYRKAHTRQEYIYADDMAKITEILTEILIIGEVKK